MKELKDSCQQTKTDLGQVQINEDDFFVVIKNHRQSCIRRYLRKIRKQRQKQKRRQEEKWEQEAQRNRNALLNLTMLKEQYLWQVLMDDQKVSHNSDTVQSGAEKTSKIEQAIQFVQHLPAWPKRNLFTNQFLPFEYCA